MVFLFFNNDKGEKNKGPNKDVHGLKCGSLSLTAIGFGSLRPPTGDSYLEEWGKDVLRQHNTHEEMSFEEYCMINLGTDVGLQIIAKYNGCEETSTYSEIKFITTPSLPVCQTRR